MTTEKNVNSINFNVDAHNKIAFKYEKIHGEIYNPLEQERLRRALQEALSLACTESDKNYVLDLGCGAGNLTSHLVDLGASVVAADVSPLFLELISDKFKHNEVKTIILNGKNLENIKTNTFDMVATYSVLHHIPDYLITVEECMRVLKPGGVLFVDHEAPDEFWEHKKKFSDFYSKAQIRNIQYFMKYLRPVNYYDFFIRKFINSRYRREGDIHVFDDDHIEWKMIKASVEKYGDLLIQRDYLLFRSGYDQSIYEIYKTKLSDMRLGIYRKRL